MRLQKWMVIAWVVFAALVAWIRLAGPDRILGMDGGTVGFVLVALVALAALFGLRSLPSNGFDVAISPAEARAWGNLMLIGIVLACVIAESAALMGALSPGDVQRVVRRSYVLFLVIGAIGWMINRRWKPRVQSDERDREIGARAATWGRASLALSVFAVLALLAGSPPEYLAWASHQAIAHLLLYTIVFGFLVEHGYMVVRYWRDRRS